MSVTGTAAVWNASFLRHCLAEKRPFAKTGSGQSIGKVEKDVSAGLLIGKIRTLVDEHGNMMQAAPRGSAVAVGGVRKAVRTKTSTRFLAPLPCTNGSFVKTGSGQV